MTREEAIRLIGWLKCTTNREDDLEAIDMAIEALSAKPQTDLISRADAIEAVWRAITSDELVQGSVEEEILKLPSADAVSREFYEDAVKANIGLVIKNRELKEQIESADAVQEWIPCSERLPEKDELVLVTVWNGVSIAWRSIYARWESAEDVYEKGDVTAWMPLPKPYKGGDTE